MFFSDGGCRNSCACGQTPAGCGKAVVQRLCSHNVSQAKISPEIQLVGSCHSVHCPLLNFVLSFQIPCQHDREVGG